MEFNGVKGIELTKHGKFEVTIHHAKLPRGRVSRSFDFIKEAADYKVFVLSQLNGGTVLPELLPVENTPSISAMLATYLRECDHVAKTSAETCEKLFKEFSERKELPTLDWLTPNNIADWVRDMKRVQHLAPSTLRKRVEALARAVDWTMNRKYGDTPGAVIPPNPLRAMRDGYSAYTPSDLEFVTKKTDEGRSWRLAPGEYEAFLSAAQGVKRPDRERPWGMNHDREDFVLLFQLLVGTGLRLKEAFTLEWSQWSDDECVIKILKTKTSWRDAEAAKRDIPISPELHNLLGRHHDKFGDRRYIFPWVMDVVVTSKAEQEIFDNEVRTAGNLISKRFVTLFGHCGVDDLIAHDLRHEAICRFMEMKTSKGEWMYRKEDVMAISGHKTEKMFRRYYSVRGNDLAARMRE